MIVLRFALPGDFIEIYDRTRGPLGSVFYATKKPPALYDTVKVQLRFFDGKSFRTRCRVDQLEMAGPGSPGGAWLSFVPSEWRVRDLALAYAEGHDIPYSPRRHARINARLPAKVRLGNMEIQAHTEDISTGGVLIRTSRRVPAGTTGKLTVKIPGQFFPVTVEVTVARSGTGGELGLRLAGAGNRKTRRFETIVEKLKNDRSR